MRKELVALKAKEEAELAAALQVYEKLRENRLQRIHNLDKKISSMTTSVVSSPGFSMMLTCVICMQQRPIDVTGSGTLGVGVEGKKEATSGHPSTELSHEDTKDVADVRPPSDPDVKKEATTATLPPPSEGTGAVLAYMPSMSKDKSAQMSWLKRLEQKMLDTCPSSIIPSHVAYKGGKGSKSKSKSKVKKQNTTKSKPKPKPKPKSKPRLKAPYDVYTLNFQSLKFRSGAATDKSCSAGNYLAMVVSATS